MKFSTYINNIIDAIFFPKFLIEDKEINKKLMESYKKLIKTQSEYCETGWQEAKNYAKQCDNLNQQLDILRENNKNITAINNDLNRKLERYYKTGKNSRKK